MNIFEGSKTPLIVIVNTEPLHQKLEHHRLRNGHAGGHQRRELNTLHLRLKDNRGIIFRPLGHYRHL